MHSEGYSHSIYWAAKKSASRASAGPRAASSDAVAKSRTASSGPAAKSRAASARAAKARPFRPHDSLTVRLCSEVFADPRAASPECPFVSRHDSAMMPGAILTLSLLLSATLAYDIGMAMADGVRRLADPGERARMAADFRREMRILRRPFYYRRETERRRLLAAERRKLHRRRTDAPMPTPEALLDLWNRRKASKENMILLGGMLHDLECYVDNGLRIDADGAVVGRNRGIRGWLAENLPELSAHYKTLMRYKAMAIRLRQATGTEDPKPTAALLDETPPHEVVAEIREDFRTTFSSIEDILAERLDPERVLGETRAMTRADEGLKQGRLKQERLKQGRLKRGQSMEGTSRERS